jgi:hypothetical protein
MARTFECFACEPTSPSLEGISFQRALCVEHKSRCRVENGELLSVVMQRAEPVRFPLEGGALAKIYNPVFVEGNHGCRLKGWTDFAGGGMAVFEDRYSAKNYFEFWVLERNDAVELLHSIRRRVGYAKEEMLTPNDLIILLAPGADPVQKLTDPLNATFKLWDLWREQRNLERLRAEEGRPWPDSYNEMTSWLKTMRAEPTEHWPSIDEWEAKFIANLQELALRRFPEIRTEICD